MTSLISPHDTWALWAVIIAGTGLAIGLEQRYTWAARLSGPVLALLIAMGLSNLRVMPTDSPVYETVNQYLVPLAIPLLLFRADAFQILRTTGRMFIAFHISALGSLIGALAAFLLLKDLFAHTSGAAGHQGSTLELAQVGGIMAASYIGGALNFIAVKETFHTSSDLTGPLLVADNFVMAGVFLVLLFIAASRVFLARYPHPHTHSSTGRSGAEQAAAHWHRKEISLLDIAKALGVAFAIVAGAAELSERIAGRLADSMLRDIATNRFVLITFLTMAAATLFARPMQRIHGPEELGGYMLYVFLFVIGLPANLISALRNVPLLFVYCLIMAIVNLLLTLAAGRLLRFNLEELLLCVNASLGGPPSAAAMAIAKGWSRLILPAILIGIWGYVIGTPLGVAAVRLLMRLG